MDDDVADPEPAARPVALREPVDAADDEVRPEPAAIGAERPDGAVRRETELKGERRGNGRLGGYASFSPSGSPIA